MNIIEDEITSPVTPKYSEKKVIDYVIRNSLSNSHTKKIIYMIKNRDITTTSVIECYKDINEDLTFRGYIIEVMAIALINMGRNNNEFINLLIYFIADDSYSYYLKSNIIEELGKIKNSDINIINILIDMITAPNEIIPNFDYEAAISLTHIKIDDIKTIDVLIDIINNKNIDSITRQHVALSLGNSKKDDNKVINALITFIKNEYDLDMRRDITKFLASIGVNDDAIISTLIEIVITSDPNDSYSNWRKEALDLLENIGKSNDIIINKFINIIKDKNKSISFIIRKDIATSLVNIGNNNIIRLLIDMTKDKNIPLYIRGNITFSLGYLRKDEEIIDILIMFIKDKKIDSSIRGNIAYSLGEIGKNDNKIVDVLINFIKDENIDINIRCYLIESFEYFKMSNNKTMNILIDLIIDPKIAPSVRLEITRSLAKMGRADMFFRTLTKEDLLSSEIIKFMESLPLQCYFTIRTKRDIFLKIIKLQVLENHLPLYIKDNKLCCLYRGEKIQSKYNLSLKDIENLKKESSGIDLSLGFKPFLKNKS